VSGIGPEIVVAGLGGLVFGWAVSLPSLWRDEAATLSVSRRSLTQIAAVLQQTDLVHGGYYLFAHLALSLHDSVTSLRLVSVIAMALTAVLLVRIGRVLGSAGIGITAAALLVASPLATRYAQEARPFALVTLAATASTYALLRALGSTADPDQPVAVSPAPAPAPAPAPTPASRTRWTVYATSLVLLGLANVIALLVVVPHALIVLRRCLTTADRSRLPQWAGRAGLAAVLVGPFLLAAWSQRGQVDWITRPHLYDLTGVFVQAYQSRWPVLLAGLAAAAVLVRSRGIPAGPAGDALVTGAVWATLPPVALWTVSQVKPLFDLHYVVFCLPGTALFLASLPWALTPTRWRALGATGLVAVLAVLGVNQQGAYRDPQTGHAENLRGVADYLRTHALPADAVLFNETNLRVLVDVSPQDLRGLRNLGQARSAAASDTLFGVSIPPEEVAPALAEAPRVWVVRGIPGQEPGPGTTEAAQRDELAAHYTERSHAELSTILVTLYVRTP